MSESSVLRKSRFLDVGQVGNVIVFSFRRCFEEQLGLRLRQRESLRRARSRLKHIGVVQRLSPDGDLALPQNAISTADLEGTLDDLDDLLAGIAERPLTAHQVEQALAITAQERSRWTKDKRLPSAGTDLIRRGQVIGLSTYPVDAIAQLIGRPQTIQIWREADKPKGGPHAEKGR